MNKFLVFFAVCCAMLASTVVGFAAQSFDRDLYFGLRSNEDVRSLQQFLTDKGFYSGPITGNFFTLTRDGVKKFQLFYRITPVLGYFGPKSRQVANREFSSRVMSPVPSMEAPSVPEVSASSSAPSIPPIVFPQPSRVVKSAMKIESVYPSNTPSRYTNIVLNELRLSDDSLNSQGVAVKRIRFHNAGTLPDANFVGVSLINARTGYTLASARINRYSALASVAASVKSGYVEFALISDASKPDRGLMVSGNTYTIFGSFISPGTAVKRTVRLDIAAESDVDAVDFNDLTRPVDISTMNIFPIEGPTITLP